MNRGSKFLATAAVVALSGCGGEHAELQIRSMPAPLSATSKPVPARIAEARGQLALGSLGLAIESFRKALREQPDSVEAMAGLAACYDGMNRFDLSRRYYESALAVAPADPALLTAFARSLDAQGRTEEATAVRHEINVRLASTETAPAPASQLAAAPELVVEEARPAISRSVTVMLPPARPVAAAAPERPAVVQAQQNVARAKTVAAASPPAAAPAVIARKKLEAAQALSTPAAAPVVIARKEVAAAAPVAPQTLSPRPTPADIARKKLESAAAISAPPSAPIAVALKAPPVAAPPPLARKAPEVSAPPSLPAAAPATVARNILEETVAPTLAVTAPVIFAKVSEVVAAAPPTPAPTPAPVIVASDLPSGPLRRPNSAPHLERMSPGVVALVTTGRPAWRTELVARTAQSTTVRFVPLHRAVSRPMPIRLLNAARHQGLAARTRSLLADRGWRQIAIGDANRVRQTSLILYPASRRSTALRLSAQFGVPIARRASGSELVMLIGRDATKRGFIRAGG